jgi:acetyltransferase-like isoleucine patch superfamily enzyme
MGRRLVVCRPYSLSVGDRVFIEDDVFFKLDADSAKLTLGNSVFIGKGAQLDVAGEMWIGNNVLIAPGVFVTDHHHGMALGRPMMEQSGVTLPVVIGNDVWIGARAVILPGVSLGEGSVVGAGSVVTKSVAPRHVVAGVPARVLRQRTAGDEEQQVADQ